MCKYTKAEISHDKMGCTCYIHDGPSSGKDSPGGDNLNLNGLISGPGWSDLQSTGGSKVVSNLHIVVL
jgi:hypothetical protein